MKGALYDPDGGYYQRRDRVRWGREADYRTSPERSELFAATWAHYFARLSREFDDLNIVECGAGDGSFAAELLATLREQAPAVFANTQYRIFETSADARLRAQQRLAEFGDRVKIYDDWDLLSVNSGIYFSNELLDAFPVHRVVKTEAEVLEFYVALDDQGDFTWSTGSLSTPKLKEFFDTYSIELALGQIAEINLRIDEWLAQVAAKLENGYVITVDYGAEADELYEYQLRPNGTLRGFARHAFVENLLSQPGDCDLTASVNWTQVRTVGAALGLREIEFTSQQKFLLKEGLLEQLEYRLQRVKDEAEKAALTAGAREMILPGGMASSFQVLIQRRLPDAI